MKTAIYTTAFGHEYYYLLAEELCKSLRKVGYDQDIFALTDKEYVFSSSVTNIVIPKTEKPLLYKSSFYNNVDVTNYDSILFVDSDIVFINNPEPIFKLNKDDLTTYVSNESKHRLGINLFNLKYFTYEERKDILRSNIPSINTGLILFPSKIIKSVSELWHNEWTRLTKGIYERWDQSVFQVMALRNQIKYSIIPDNIYSYPLRGHLGRPVDKDTIAIHLCGEPSNNKLEVLNLMKETNENGISCWLEPK